MDRLTRSMKELAATHAEPGDFVEFSDHGAVRSGSPAKRAIKKAIWHQLTKSSTAQHGAMDYNIVAVSERHVTFIPVKIGILGGWKLRRDDAVETFPRNEVRIGAGEKKTRSGLLGDLASVIVTFDLPDANPKTLELYHNPERWQVLAAE